MTRVELEEALAMEAVVAWFADEPPADAVRATIGWADPLADASDPTAGVGPYLRVYGSHAERIAGRRVALAALLELHDHEVEPLPPGRWTDLLERASRPPDDAP
jgi:hypothetical protein